MTLALGVIGGKPGVQPDIQIEGEPPHTRRTRGFMWRALIPFKGAENSVFVAAFDGRTRYANDALSVSGGMGQSFEVQVYELGQGCILREVFPPTQVDTSFICCLTRWRFLPQQFTHSPPSPPPVQSALESLDVALVVIPSAVFLWHVPNMHLSSLNAAARVAQAVARALAVGGAPLKISEAVARSEPRLFRALFPGWISKPHTVFPDIHDKNRSEFVRRFVEFIS